MRKFFCFLLLLCGVQISQAQFLPAKVDERFELTSIACRLAGADEYTRCRIPEYSKDIDDYFSNYTSHPLIAFLQEIRNSYSVSYSDFPCAAIRLEIKNNKICLRKPYTLSDITQDAPRWNTETLERYIFLLNDFYKTSHFRKFYDDHSAFYASLESSMNRILNSIDINWLQEFYGQPFGTRRVYVSPTNGSSNYAIHNTEMPTILVGAPINNNPSYDTRFSIAILHELAHHFDKLLVEEYKPKMQDALTRISPFVEQMLYKTGYGTSAIVSEWFTRLAVLAYLKDHSPKNMPALIATDCNQGLIWQARAVAFMENFHADRNCYPHFEDFLPQLVGFINFTAQNIEKVVTEYENRRPYVVNVYPAIGSDVSLAQDTVSFRVTFSEPMATYAQGMKLIGSKLEALATINIPSDWETGAWVDEYTFVVRLKPEWIVKGEISGFTLIGNFMINTHNYALDEDFNATFNMVKNENL